jgi:hypothetical protein
MSVMCSFQFSRSSNISPIIRCFLTISACFVLRSNLSLNLVFPSFSGLFLWISMDFVFSCDILKPLSLSYLLTLFAFIMVSALIGALLLVTVVTITQSSAYPRIVHVSLISLTISAIAIKNRVTLKTVRALYHSILDFF